MRHKFEVCGDELEQCKLMEFYWNAGADFKSHLLKTTDAVRTEFSSKLGAAFSMLPQTRGGSHCEIT